MNDERQPELLSVKAYARHRRERGLRGGTPQAVRAAIKSGRIARTCREHMRCPADCSAGGIYAQLADADWKANTQTRGPGAIDPEHLTFRQQQLDLRVRLAQLEVGERSGELIPAAQVRREQYHWWREIRDAALGIPRRTAPRLVAATDETKRAAILQAEVEALIERFSEDFNDGGKRDG
ncbi:MAG: hypothetical protein GF355_02885 [Candidatus Eisenbacteria bacterium]|nr:hypothetical protein [Candidatus Eisenbacteria bacterium]